MCVLPLGAMLSFEAGTFHIYIFSIYLCSVIVTICVMTISDCFSCGRGYRL